MKKIKINTTSGSWDRHSCCPEPAQHLDRGTDIPVCPEPAQHLIVGQTFLSVQNPYHQPRLSAHQVIIQISKPTRKTDRQECLVPRSDVPEQTGMSVPRSVFLPTLSSGIPIQKSFRHLPHWTCDAVLYWITFRLADSLPQDKLKAWQEEKDIWLKHNPKPWSDKQFLEYMNRFGDRLEKWLDTGYGSRALARQDIRTIVQECMLRFNGERLLLHAAVIMPNHVHLLMETLGQNKLPQIMKGMKGVSARKTNQYMGSSGKFWSDESFDHIVRNEFQYKRLIQYVAENPTKAGLKNTSIGSTKQILIMGQTFLSVQNLHKTSIVGQTFLSVQNPYHQPRLSAHQVIIQISNPRRKTDRQECLSHDRMHFKLTGMYGREELWDSQDL